MTKRNICRTESGWTLRRKKPSFGLAGVRIAAQRDKNLRFTALLHHVNEERLLNCFNSMNRTAAVGVDEVTWVMYRNDLLGNISRLHERIHKGRYRAVPSLRVYIPKPAGGKRPLGIAALEDKLVQSALCDVLNCIYEVDFRGFSYGFRKGRNQHQALDALSVGIYRKRVSLVLDADIRGFFDNIDHDWMLKFLGHRIGDKRVLRLITQWLRAGVLENGIKIDTETGTPQGSGISPLLANIYLHYALDLWVGAWRRRCSRGSIVFIRYCDDFVVGFACQSDAVAFQKALQLRLSKFGLSLHPQKTRLIRFGVYAFRQCQQLGLGKPETFDFLGFTHICAKTWKNKKFTIKRITIKKRFAAKLRVIRNELWDRRHEPVLVQAKWLRSVIQGHMNYYAVPGNGYRIEAFGELARKHWIRAMRRRSQTHNFSFKRFARFADKWIPRVRIIHPYPSVRFDVMYSR